MLRELDRIPQLLNWAFGNEQGTLENDQGQSLDSRYLTYRETGPVSSAEPYTMK